MPMTARRSTTAASAKTAANGFAEDNGIDAATVPPTATTLKNTLIDTSGIKQSLSTTAIVSTLSLISDVQKYCLLSSATPERLQGLVNFSSF
jgi:hypothetical protein